MQTLEQEEAIKHVKRAKQMIGFRREKLNDPNTRRDVKPHLEAEIEAIEYMMDPVESALEEHGIKVDYQYVPTAQRRNSPR